MVTVAERLGIVETKVINLDEKIDLLKMDVKEMHDCLDKTRDGIQEKLDKMYDASCEQHATLGKELKSLKQDRDRVVFTFTGIVIAVTLLSGHIDKILKFLS
jgi:hypothetical protein